MTFRQFVVGAIGAAFLIAAIIKIAPTPTEAYTNASLTNQELLARAASIPVPAWLH
jgi:hypothetical protein